jgi:hypothetical protein
MFQFIARRMKRTREIRRAAVTLQPGQQVQAAHRSHRDSVSTMIDRPITRAGERRYERTRPH